MNKLTQTDKNILLDLINDEIDTYLMIEDQVGPDDDMLNDGYISVLNNIKTKLEKKE